MARATRHGPVISDTGLILAPAGHALALAWTGELPDDRTAEALLKMNRATSAADFRVALQDFATPQQNVVFADVAGATGFMAPGRIPQRRNLYEQSRLPVPGWTADADWTGVIPFDALPQQSNPVDGWFATANNDVSGYAKGGFYGMGWDLGYRYHRIADRLATISKMSLADSVELQHDLVAGGLLPLLKAWLPKVSGHADVTAALLAWDGQMRRDRAEPLIVTSWVDHLAHRLMAGRLGELYVNWWFWQLDILKQLTSDEHWCDDPTTAAHESCGDQLSTSLDDALADLGKTYGSDWSAWRWGNAHRMTYESPFWRNVPLANKLLRGTLPDDGDNMTIDCATALPSLAGDYPAIHGPSMRFSVDMAEPLSPVFALAGGQSGNPLSPHYDDQLPAWRDGLAKPIATTITHHLVLQPFPGAP
jgi:penicillin amidase